MLISDEGYLIKEPAATPLFTLETHKAVTLTEEIHESLLLPDSSRTLGLSVSHVPNLVAHNEDETLIQWIQNRPIPSRVLNFAGL